MDVGFAVLGLYWYTCHYLLKTIKLINVKSKFLILTFILLGVASVSLGQQIYPIPQEQLTGPQQYPYTGIKLGSGASQQVTNILTPFLKKDGVAVKFKKSNKLKNKEGYELVVGNKNILISYSSSRGAFYAAQSLRQILEQAEQTNHLQKLTVKDYPDIAFRGTVEGFYGEPWSFQDRIAQLQFYGRWKMNTYLYGPKDDPFHSSPHWRDPYPVAEAQLLRQLIDIAKENEIDFYWAIHPGKDIQWNKKDSLAVLHKFELMYDLGVRHFAVFFDDIAGEGTKAEKQAGLLNYLQTSFVDKKKDVGPLVMCPTEYNKLWSNPKPNTYLDILGSQLDKKIEIMWTGNTVIHDITKEGQDWVNARIARPSFVWWNFPVSDYVRNHLLLGPVYGLDKDINKDMSGFVTNPMDKAEASKVAIFSVADYTWNMKAFDSQKSWLRGIHELVPEVNEFYTLFSKHNTDPGPSYHQYRRLESEGISSILDSLLGSISTTRLGKGPAEDLNLTILRGELSKFSPAVQGILKGAKNEQLIDEIKPWLMYFEQLGEAGIALLDILQSSDDKEAYTHFLKLKGNRDSMINIDNQNNRNPYQPGIVTGSRHILPWVEKSYFHYASLLRQKGFSVPDAVDQASGSVITSLEPLKSLPVLNDVVMGNKPQQVLRLSPVLEVIKLNPDDLVGIKILTRQIVKEAAFKTTPHVEGLRLEFTEDGQSWSIKKTNKSKQVRLKNISGDILQIKLEKFEVILN